MKNSILILTIFLLFTGCTFKQQRIDINHYSIDFKTQKISQNAKLSSIFIEEPNVNRSFNLTSIYYNTKPYLFEEYSKNKWINLPSNMIYNQLIDSFIASNIFSNVISKDSRIEHKYTLRTDIIKLYHEFKEDKSYAILKIKFDLIEDKKIIKTISFDKNILCETNDAYGFVKALNKGLEESTNSLLNSIISI